MTTFVLKPDAVVLRDTVSMDTVIAVEDDVITDVRRTSTTPEDTKVIHGTLLPGLIDLQVNGAGGCSVDEATPEVLEQIAAQVLVGGAVAFCPTLITAPIPELCRQARAVAQWMDTATAGAVPIGIHLEGPFLDEPGTHDASAMCLPTTENVARLIDACAGKLRLLTLAPGVEGAPAAVRRLVDAGVTVSLGHGSSCDGVKECLDAGAAMGTHLFNGMGHYTHRSPGMADALIDDVRASASLICDGIHVHETKVRQVWKCLGVDRLLLVSDSVAAAGMPDGDYPLAGITVTRRGNAVRNANGGLAGSCLTMADAVRCFLELVPDAGPWSVARIAATNPATVLGLDRDGWGKIEVGAPARFTVLGSDGGCEVWPG